VAAAVAVLRVAGLAAVLLGGIGLAVALPLLGRARRDRAVRGWFRAVVASTGVRLVVTGAPSPTDDALSAGGAVLVTANHLSWLDIPAILAVQPMRVVAKSDVRGWPVLGYLAARAGSIFIDRRRLRRLPLTVAEIAAALRGGESVLVFPEGSTWCGRESGRFRPATMQSAIDAAVPVRPLTLSYLVGDGSLTTAAAWVGDDTLLASVWRIARSRGLRARIEVKPLVETSSRTRRQVARSLSESGWWPAGVGVAGEVDDDVLDGAVPDAGRALALFEVAPAAGSSHTCHPHGSSCRSSSWAKIRPHEGAGSPPAVRRRPIIAFTAVSLVLPDPVAKRLVMHAQPARSIGGDLCRTGGGLPASPRVLCRYDLKEHGGDSRSVVRSDLPVGVGRLAMAHRGDARP